MIKVNETVTITIPRVLKFKYNNGNVHTGIKMTFKTPSTFIRKNCSLAKRKELNILMGKEILILIIKSIIGSAIDESSSTESEALNTVLMLLTKNQPMTKDRIALMQYTSIKSPFKLASLFSSDL